jgi:hypothetical protein
MVTEQQHVGYVVISKESPMRATKIYADLFDESVREGDVVTIVSKDGSPLAIGVVSNVEVYSAVDRFEYASLSTRLTQGPPPTTPKLFRKASINILVKLKNETFDKAYAIKLPERSDTNALWKSLIPDPKKRILAGFLKGSEPMPAFYHADFLLGPEGAHLNVGGMSGLAAKTSYLRFLMFSLIEYMERTQEDIYIIAFNVKRLDFMGLHRIPESENDLDKYIESWGRNKGIDNETLKIYKQMYKEIFNAMHNYKNNIKYFTYMDDPYRNKPEFMENAQVYSYGVLDLGTEGLIAGLFEEEDEASILQMNLITKIMNVIVEHSRHSPSMNTLRESLDCLRAGRSSSRPNRSGTQSDSAQSICARVLQEMSPDPRTVEAVMRRLDGFLERAKHIIDRSNPSSSPIRAEGFVKGVNVIQLYGLSDVEKRVVVSCVINNILKFAEEEQRKGKDKAFVIIVDELNKYAPTSKSPIKKTLVEIAARGRDLRVSLFGAEQFPSDIDSQVLGNTGSLVVGRMPLAELEEKMYKIFGELRNNAGYLGKGEVLVHHPIYLQPLILSFPPPINDIIRESQSTNMVT